MVKCGVLFEVLTGFVNNIQTSFIFTGLNLNSVNQMIVLMVKSGVLFEVLTVLKLNSVKQLIFVMVKCGVLFEVRQNS
jgi:hypothetical protein